MSEIPAVFGLIDCNSSGALLTVTYGFFLRIQAVRLGNFFHVFLFLRWSSTTLIGLCPSAIHVAPRIRHGGAWQDSTRQSSFWLLSCTDLPACLHST